MGTSLVHTANDFLLADCAKWLGAAKQAQSSLPCSHTAELNTGAHLCLTPCLVHHFQARSLAWQSRSCPTAAFCPAGPPKCPR